MQPIKGGVTKVTHQNRMPKDSYSAKIGADAKRECSEQELADGYASATARGSSKRAIATNAENGGVPKK